MKTSLTQFKHYMKDLDIDKQYSVMAQPLLVSPLENDQIQQVDDTYTGKMICLILLY